MAFGAQRAGGDRRQQRRRGSGGELCPHPPAAAGGQGRRPQLPRHLVCARLAAGLDPGDESGAAARCFRTAGRAPGHGATAGGERGCRGDVDRRLHRRNHPRRALRAGRWLHLGGRDRAGHRRWLRQFLQDLRQRRGGPAGGRGGDRRRAGAGGQRGQRPGPVLGTEGGLCRQLRHRHPDDPEDPRPARYVWRPLLQGTGQHRGPVACAGGPGPALLSGQPVQRPLGRADHLRR